MIDHTPVSAISGLPLEIAQSLVPQPYATPTAAQADLLRIEVEFIPILCLDNHYQSAFQEHVSPVLLSAQDPQMDRL
jgi:hypothetical protein